MLFDYMKIENQGRFFCVSLFSLYWMSWSNSSSKSLLFVKSDNIVQGPRSLVIQSSFADQFVLISLQEIEHEKKKENGDFHESKSASDGIL